MATAQTDRRSFSKHFRGLSAPYRLLVLIPPDSKTTRKPSGPFKLLIVLAVVIYWIGVGFALARTSTNNSSVSIASNAIQLLLNAVSLSVLALNPTWNYRAFCEVLAHLDDVDQLLGDTSALYRKSGRRFIYSFGAVLVFLCYAIAFNFYVSVLRHETSNVPYWILCILPLPFQVFAGHLIIFLLLSVHQRLSTVGLLLREAQTLSGTKRQASVLMVRPVGPEVRHETLCLATKDLFLASERINDYFGLSLLSLFGALFTVSSVQSFYALHIAMTHDGSDYTRTGWLLVASVNEVLIDLALVFGLCYAADLVLQDAQRMLATALEDPQQSEGNGWLRVVLTRFKLNATGFFAVNLNTLFGFSSALVTYLIILLQFNFIMEDKDPYEKGSITITHSDKFPAAVLY